MGYQSRQANDAFYELLRKRYSVRYDDDVSFAADGSAQGAAP